MKVLIYFWCVASSLCVIRAAVQISKCSDDLPVPTEFRFNNCSEKLCLGSVHDDVKLGVDFEARYPSQKLVLELVLKVSGYTFYKKFEDICTYIVDGTCPLSVGQSYSMSNNVKVPTNVQGYYIYSTVFLVDENSNKHFCFNFEFKLS